MDIISRRLDIHPTLSVEFLVVVGIAIELRPYADHEPSMHGVNGVEHRLRIGETGSFELMAAPLILGPVIPILYDIIDGDMTLTELTQCLLDLSGSLIALTALPEAQHPLRIERGLTRQRTIAGDDLIEVLTSNEVIVHILGHLTPNAQFATILSTARF